MTKNEKKFWGILTNLFVGAEVKGKSGFISLMRAKKNYFDKVQKELLSEISDITKNNAEFKEELYDKLYSFFHRYFSESGSIYYNYTPLFYNIYTKGYETSEANQETTYVTDYEQVISNKQDTSLFYKTQMLYYVKSDKIFKDLEITIEDKKYLFDVSNMQGKSANEKRELVYTLEEIKPNIFSFSVEYSVKGRKTKMEEMLKQAKKEKVVISEEDLKKAFRVFERQTNIDYFINKDAKKFLTEQLDLWIYQYLFAQEADFDIKRFEQIKSIKKVSLKLIDFISQFENELVKIWNKPRFVTNSNIVVTMDKLEAKGFDTSKLKEHKGYQEQLEEWKELGIVESEGLLTNQHLPVDTKYFKDLQEEIEALFEEEEFDGLLIKSENYQALNTILPRYKGKIDLIYIDPPFNTGDDFDYIDRFQDSTWLSLMENRLAIAQRLMNNKSNFYLHLDTKANHFGRLLLDNVFGKEKFINEIIWCYSGPGYWKRNFVRKHDTIFYYGNKSESIFNPQFIEYKSGIHVNKDGVVKTFGGGEKESKSQEIEERGKPVEDWWTDIYATDRYRNEMEGFDTQKPETLLQRIIQASSINQSVVLDYHSGSGTTIATAHKLDRKWIGIEMGEHFETINLPRMKKTLSGYISGISKELDKENNLKKGGLFKYYELEQYEQILRNLKYTDVPSDWLKNLKSEDITDCFLFDGKLSEALDSKTESYTIDISQLYEDIDLKETIHNITGKRPTEVTETTVTYADGSSYPLMEILKPLLVW